MSNTNNIDWNNAITGSPANTVNLNIGQLRGRKAVTNAVSLQAHVAENPSPPKTIVNFDNAHAGEVSEKVP
jgi:hypothetical protein